MLDEDEEQFEKENVFREVCLSCASISTLDNENFLLVIFHILIKHVRCKFFWSSFTFLCVT